MVQTPDVVYRDFVTDNVPSSGANKPKKQEIRDLLNSFKTTIDAFTSNGGLIYDTKANLDADLAHEANTQAWVVGDGTASNNGIYRKSGASGAGSWTRVADLPYSILHATNAGAGTANAVQATTTLAVSSTAYSQLISLPFVLPNTGAMTLALNGGTPLDLVTNTGAAIPSGYVKAGMALLLMLDSNGDYRLFSYGDASAVQAAAEAAQGYAEEWAQKAEDTPVSVAAGGDGSTDFSSLHWAAKAADYAALALNNWVIDTFPGDGATKDFTLSVAPGLAANCFVTVDGVLQQKSTYSVTGTTLSFTTAPPGDGVTLNIEVAHGTAVVMDINDATTFNGQNPAYYLDLANSTGTVPNARLPARIQADALNSNITDWHDVVQSGVYRGNNATNAPTNTGSGDWYYGYAVAFSSTYLEIIAVKLTDRTKIYRLINHAGTWGSWEPVIWSETELDARYAAQSSGTWTPAISFGGAAVGATYTANNKGSWIKTGKLVVAKFQLELTAKGSSTGNASMTGLPFASADDGIFGGGAVGLAALLSTVTGSIGAAVNPDSSEVFLYQAGDGSSVRLTNANFTDTSYIYGTLTYEAAS